MGKKNKEPTANPVGRPKKEIGKKTFENLCSIQCTKDDICLPF